MPSAFTVAVNVALCAGVALSLEGAARRLDATDADAAGALRRGAAQTRGSVRTLRNLLVEIYPPSLQRAGLRSALEDLLAPIAARGIETALDYDDSLDLGVEQEALCFRVSQESVRNTVKHADASSVGIRLSATAGGAELEVSDDGHGFDPAAEGASSNGEAGHIGTHLMSDLAAEAGAELDVESAPGRGTVVRLVFPTRS